MRLEQLGIAEPSVHATLLKEWLFLPIHEPEAHYQGSDVLLVFKRDVELILVQANQYVEAVHLANADETICCVMLQYKSEFNIISRDGFLEEAVPPLLLQFVCMLKHGADIQS